MWGLIVLVLAIVGLIAAFGWIAWRLRNLWL